MFKHILVPTDGSLVSKAAIDKAVQLARSIGASLTGITVGPVFHVFTFRPAEVEDTEEDRWDMKAHAAAYLRVIEDAARAAGVPCDTVLAISDQPYEAIVHTAQARACDLIVMGSHGRSGLTGALLGSQTQRVLAHAPIPVLVVRAGA
jgi:nucleotide-binding universal stress UspA family protein